jgi:LacI family transcriptional regulator, repressor for deo operon, udp, cdd, tsx, nupC, and nupG
VVPGDAVSGGSPPRAKPAGIKDVAALAGVSLKTVTNVVHDRPYVSVQTRAKVQAAIAELDYRPSLAGRQLQSGRSNTVTLAVPRIDEPYTGAMAHAVIEAAGRRGFSVLIDETAGRREREAAAISGYPGHGIDGVIYSPLVLSPRRMAAMSRATPMVLLGAFLPNSTADYVGIDDQRSARDLIDHLVATGRRRIAFLGGQAKRWTGVYQRLDSVLHRLREHGLPAGPSQVINTGRFTRYEGRKVMTAQSATLDADALVCASDLLAIGAMSALREAGISVPDDVAVAGWDNVVDGQYHVPTLTTVAPDLAALADATMAALVARIEGDRSPGTIRCVPHELIVRQSTASAATT